MNQDTCIDILLHSKSSETTAAFDIILFQSVYATSIKAQQTTTMDFELKFELRWLAELYNLISDHNYQCVFVCLYINQIGTNGNCCTQRLVIMYAEIY